MTDAEFRALFAASTRAALEQKPLPRCAVPGCALGVAATGPKVDYGGLEVYVGPLLPISDKCWYHATGKTPPLGAR